MLKSQRIFAVTMLGLLSACQHSLPMYLIQQGMMQGSLYMKAQPIDELLKSDDLPAKDREFLIFSRSVLDFARKDLGLKTKGSYEKFLKLDRPWVSKVVIAAYKDRAEPFLFSFPIFGKLPYRGYFEEASAQSFAEKIAREKNLDVMIRPVPAYSTTGWLSDPIVSTMFHSQADLAELLFHELVHLQFYFDSNADFNEAFATWYAGKAVRRFLAVHPEAFVDPK
jgi:predicted aminopeptidase